MNVEERCLGVSLSPEAKELVRTVFEHALEPVEGRVDHARVRVMAAPEGVACRARVWPNAGSTVVVTARGASAVEAVLASAKGLVRQLQRRDGEHGRRVRRHHAS